MKNYLISFILGVLLSQMTIGQAIWHQYQGPFAGGVASYVSKSDTIFVGTIMGIYYSTDKGKTWAITGETKGWHDAILTYNNLLISESGYSKDNGKNWSPYLNGWCKGFRALYTFKGSVYCGTDNGVFKFIPGDKSWVLKSSGIRGTETWQKDSIITTFSSIGDILMCGTFNKGLFLSRDGGETWEHSTGLDNYIVKLFNFKDTIFAVSNNVFFSSDSGKNWNSIKYNLDNSFITDIEAFNDTIIISSPKGVFKYDKSNLKWKSLTDESFQTLFVNDNNLFASNWFGLYRWNSLNNQFELSNDGINTARVLDLALFNKKLYCATEAGTYYTPDDGKSWNEVVETKKTYSHTLAKNDTMLYIGTNKGIFSSSIHSDAWQPLNNGLTSKVVWDIEACGNTLFAATDSGPFISKNRGKNWIPITEGFRHTNSASQYGTGQIQALTITSGSGMVLASNNFGLYKLSNDSTKWELVGFPEEGAEMIKIIDNTVYFGRKTSGLYKSVDSCKTWILLTNNFNGLNTYDMFKRGNNNLYVSSGYGYIYYSSDNGKRWENWSESGMPNLNVHRVIQGDSALYAGTYGRSIYKREYLKLTNCTSASYEVNGSSIAKVPANTPPDTLLSKLNLAHGASSQIIQNNSSKAGQVYVKSGDIVKVIAEDGKTYQNYTIQVLITGINDLSESDIKIYPTLTRDRIFFSQTNGIKNIVIYNLHGQVLLREKNVQNSIDVSNLQAGIYLLSIYKNDNKKINVKFVKQ